jgi:hypothetical protein
MTAAGTNREGLVAALELLAPLGKSWIWAPQWGISLFHLARDAKPFGSTALVPFAMWFWTSRDKPLTTMRHDNLKLEMLDGCRPGEKIMVLDGVLTADTV